MGMPLQWHRRHAMTLVSQLPDNTSDALLVIEAMKALVEDFLVGVPDQQSSATNVLPFGGKGSG
jgi:hypothetical protein